MKLHSPRFEKSLRRGVKQAVRSSPELKKEHRKAKGAVRRQMQAAWFFRIFFAGWMGFAVWGVISVTNHPASGLAIISLWNFFMLSVSVQNLLTLLYKATDLPALGLLPISEPEIFRWEMQKFYRKYALSSLFDQIVGFGAMAICLHLSYGQWVLAMMLAVASWTMLLALALFCAARLPRLKYQMVISSFYLLGFIVLIAHKVIGDVLVKFLDSIAPGLNLILPTGWVPSLFQLMSPGGEWMLVVLIIPIVFFISTIKNSLELLRSRLVYTEQEQPEASDQVPGVDLDEHDPDDAPILPANVGVTAIEEIIQSRQFLFQMSPQGWFEKRLWDWFNTREKALAEFAFPTGIHITKPWKLILRNFVIMVLAGYAFSKVSVTIEFWTFGIGLFITFCQCLAQILGNGSAFRVMFNSGVNIPIYAGYPISFNELSGMLFKAAVIQLPLFMVYTMACALLSTYFTGWILSTGIIFGFKIGLFIFSGRFITTALAFSACTNDSTRFRLRTVALIPIFLGSFCLYLGLGGAGLFVPNALVAWLLWFAAIIDAYILFRIYGWFYHANCFDLMSFPRR